MTKTEKKDQYRLKKWYPSLPEGMKVGDTVERFNGRSYHPFNDPNKNGIYSKEVENYPEFWEKVEEKEYEILNFINSRTGKITTTDWRPIVSNQWNINSVKRLSDGEVFTIGDKITGKTYSKPREVFGFIDYGSGKLHIDQDGGLTKLENASIYKEPLFTTYDEVDVYEGDETTAVLKHNLELLGTRVHKGNDDTLLYFSTREKAQNYIEYNTIRYSRKHIVEAFTAFKEEFPNILNLSSSVFINELDNNQVPNDNKT